MLEVAGAVARISLVRPEALNAVTMRMKQALHAALVQVREDPAIRAVVLTGTGRAFCVGQDLREHADALQTEGVNPLSTVTEHYNPIVTELATMPKPVVAALNGIAAGAGASFALAADFRVAAESAGMLFAFANIGLSLDSGASWLLPRIVGHARATALAMLADRISAEQALELGLVNAVVKNAKLESTAAELAARLAAGPTAAYAAIKESIAYAEAASLPDALAREGQLAQAMALTSDHRAATAAFLTKQRPSFVGR